MKKALVFVLYVAFFACAPRPVVRQYLEAEKARERREILNFLRGVK
jgi:hypothetical protein